MIKGLAITPPVLGGISIGKIVEKNGKRVPEKDDQFTITSQIQNKEGWIKHPLDEQLRAKPPNQNQKLRTIPVRMLFNDPDLNLRAEYTLFDRQTGQLCYDHAASCDLQSCLALQLTLQGKSTTQSYITPIYYVNLTLRKGIKLKKSTIIIF